MSDTVGTSPSEEIIVQRKPLRNFFSFWFCFGVTIQLLMVPGLVLSSNPFSLGLTIILLIPFLLGVMGLRLIIWLIFGKESILLTDTHLIVRRTGTFLLPDKSIAFFQLKGFTVHQNQHELLHGHDGLMAMWRRQMPIATIYHTGRVVIHYGNGDRLRAMSRLRYDEGVAVCRHLNERFIHAK